MKKSMFYMLCFLIMMPGIVAVSAANAEEPTKFIGQELLPPNAKAGECYARLFVPPTYKTISEMAMKREASERLLVQEPKFEFVQEQVMTKAPSEKLEIIPASYEWIDDKSLSYEDYMRLENSGTVKLKLRPGQYEWAEERVLAYPEHIHYEEVPALYETVTEKVIDRPAHTVWKKGKGPIQRIDYATGEIMCLVEVPATYKTISKRILVKPATTREVTTPAKYITVKKRIMTTPPTVMKQVIRTPATVRKIDIPAEFKTVKVRKLATPAQIQRVAIPEEFQTVSKRELVTEGRLEWRPILCETNMKPNVIYSLQRALKDAGYNPGSIDGNLGRQTMSAVQAYQKDKGLPTGQLSLETLRSLKIDF